MKQKSKKIILGIVLIISIFIIFLFSLAYVKSNATNLGRGVILGISTTYTPNSTLLGNLSLSLKEGQLIPKDSQVLISLNENKYNYNLSKLTDKQTTTGNFYIQDFSLSGLGDGYGKIGTKEEYPEVTFKIKITNNQNSEDNNKTESEIKETITPESNTNETPNTLIDSNVSQEETNNNQNEIETSITNETSTIITEPMLNDENNSNPITPAETTTSDTSTTPAETTTSDTSTEIVSSDSAEITQPTKSSEETVEITDPTTASTESSQNSETNSDTTTTTSSEIATFGLDLIKLISLITASSVEEITTSEITGTVSKNNPYIYNLNKGETVELISSSQPVNLKIENNILTITTDYSNSEEGFGEEYLSSNYDTIVLDISRLNILAEEGNLTASIIYNETEIASVQTTLNSEEQDKTVFTINETTIKNLTAINETNDEINISKNLTIVTIKSENISAYKLTEEEIFLIKGETGKTQVEIVKSEKINDRLIIKFEIGNYWIEKSYNFETSTEKLKEQIEIDSAKFIKTLAIELLKKQSEPEIIAEFLTNYSIEVNLTNFEQTQETSNTTATLLEHIENTQEANNNENTTNSLDNSITTFIDNSITTFIDNSTKNTENQNSSLILPEQNNQSIEQNNSEVSEENISIILN